MAVCCRKMATYYSAGKVVDRWEAEAMVDVEVLPQDCSQLIEGEEEGIDFFRCCSRDDVLMIKLKVCR